MADIAPPVQTSTITIGEATATWQDPIQRSTSDTVTLSDSTTQRLALLLQSVSDTLRVTDWKVTTATAALEAGIYDLVVGGGSDAVGKWALVRLASDGTARFKAIRFYTPANATLVVPLRLKVETGDQLLLMGPNAGIVNLVRRWV